MFSIDPYRPTEVQVNLGRIRDNFRWLKSLGGGFLCPMVKANAYGHGDIELSKILQEEKCQAIGVATVNEGLRLREAGITSEILVFDSYGREAAKAMLAHKLTPVVSNFEQLHTIGKEAKAPAAVHLKFNTGMNRLGFKDEVVGKVIESLQQYQTLRVSGVCTHFHSGEDLLLKDSDFTRDQLARFKEVVSQFKDKSIFFHAYNSAAAAAVVLQKQTLDLV